MKAVQNYLERSSLAGVAHISVEKSKISKLFWIIAILSGFTFAGVLIESSYRKWKASPISSSLTTHPVSELPLPSIAICPPRHSDTALNIDLENVREETFTQSLRDELWTTVNNIFMKQHHFDYYKDILNLSLIHI